MWENFEIKLSFSFMTYKLLFHWNNLKCSKTDQSHWVSGSNINLLCPSKLSRSSFVLPTWALCFGAVQKSGGLKHYNTKCYSNSKSAPEHRSASEHFGGLLSTKLLTIFF